MYMCLCVWFVHLSADTCAVPKRASDALDLELKVFVSCLTWMLGTTLKSSARMVHSLTTEKSLHFHEVELIKLLNLLRETKIESLKKRL